MFMKLIGKRIKNLRIEKGLSQETLANEAGLDRTYMTYIENAKRILQLKHYLK